MLHLSHVPHKDAVQAHPSTLRTPSRQSWCRLSAGPEHKEELPVPPREPLGQASSQACQPLSSHPHLLLRLTPPSHTPFPLAPSSFKAQSLSPPPGSLPGPSGTKHLSSLAALPESRQEALLCLPWRHPFPPLDSAQHPGQSWCINKHV